MRRDGKPVWIPATETGVLHETAVPYRTKILLERSEPAPIRLLRRMNAAQRLGFPKAPPVSNDDNANEVIGRLGSTHHLRTAVACIRDHHLMIL